MDSKQCSLQQHFLRKAETYSHAPGIAVVIMMMVMWYRAFSFESTMNAALVFGSILLLAVPTIAVSLVYHRQETVQLHVRQMDSILAKVSLIYIFALLVYFWYRVGFHNSMNGACMPYLSAALGFSMVYMLYLYYGSQKAYYDNSLVYHIGHIQWHIMGAVCVGISMMILNNLLHVYYN